MALIRESSATYSGNSPSVTLTGGLSDALVIAIIKGDAGAERTLDAATLDGASADFMENLSTDSGRAISSAVYYWLNAKHPGAGTFTLATTWSGAINNVQMEVIEYSGAHQTTTISTIATNTAANQVDGSTITSTLTGQAGELALSFEAQADSTAASVSGSITPSANLTSLTGADVFSGQSRLAVGENAIVASASEDYVWTVSQNGMTTIDSLVTGSFAIFAAAGGGITVTGQTTNFSYSAINATIDLTGEISVTGLTASYNYQAISGLVDLTGEISVLGVTPNYDYDSVNGSVELGAVISVIGQSPNYNYAGVNGVIELTGEININGVTPSYSYSAISGFVVIGEGQVIGTVTAGFADDLYSAAYKPSVITVNFKS